jgi:LysW-gamma-L-lysine carboxypeptidase
MTPPISSPTDEQAIDLLTQMVRLYSPSKQEQAVAQLILQTMARWGYRAEIDPSDNAVGHLGEGGRQIVLLGHMDTVPGEIPVRREGDLLYGRGTVDAKGPLAAFVVAAVRAGELAGLKVTVVGAVEEECASSKGAHYIAERLRPDYAVIGEPSAWNRITLGYKGRLLVDYVLERPMSHTAGQARGVCEEAVDYWLRLRAWAEAHNCEKRSRFDMLDPSLRSISSTSDGLRERVEMHLGLRLPLGLDVPRLLEELEGWRGAAEVRTHAREEPFRAEKSNPLTSAFLGAIRTEGGKAVFLTKTGTSDMNVLGPRWRCPIVAYGPGDSALDHTPEEHIDLGEYLAAIRVLTGMLRRLAQGPS